jgi:CheY-like chemotaxis protein
MRQIILIVEDNADRDSLAQMILEHAGYAVRHAVNGPQALAHAFFAEPVMVLLDLTLSEEMDGFEVLGRLKASESTAHIPVIAVSGDAEYQTRERALAAGAELCLTKPYKNSELLSKVKQILAVHKQ